MKTLQKSLIAFIAALSAGFLAILLSFSLRYSIKISLFSTYLTRELSGRSVMTALAETVIGVMLLILLALIFSRFRDQQKRTLTRICLFLLFCLSILWIFYNDTPAIYDQAKVWKYAVAMTEGDYAQLYTDYLQRYTHQKGMIFWMYLAAKVFGPGIISWRIVNAISITVIAYFFYRISGMIYKNTDVDVIQAVLMLAFVSNIIYTSFIYGTQTAQACLAAAVYGTIRYNRSNAQYRWLALPLFLCPVSVMLYKSSLIMVIAICGILFLSSFHDKATGKEIAGKAAVCILLIMLCVLTSRNQGKLFERITGVPDNDGQPSLAWLYMGLSSDGIRWGPGSFDMSSEEIFAEAGEDALLAKEIARAKIAETVSEYIHHERSLSFFADKVKWQWTEPSFGALEEPLRIRDSGDIEVPAFALWPDSFLKFYGSNIRSYLYLFLKFLLPLVYLFSLVGILFKLRKGYWSAECWIGEVYFIGGFIFQIFWESMARYCYPYYIWLFATASFGLAQTAAVIRMGIQKSVGRRKERSSI